MNTQQTASAIIASMPHLMYRAFGFRASPVPNDAHPSYTTEDAFAEIALEMLMVRR